MKRRSFLGAAAITVAAGCARTVTPPRLSDPAEPLPPIAERIGILEDKYDALVGVYGVDLATERTLAHRDGERLAVCSTFKAYLAARVLQGAQRGEWALTDTAVVDPAALKAHSPVTEPVAGQPVSLATLCKAVLQQSDNTAANMLLARIGGPPAITAFARSLGDDETRLDRWETELNSALPGDPRDTSTPRALGGGVRSLLTGTVLDDPHRRLLEDWMRANATSSMRKGLPAEWTSADKTGAGDYASTNDVGIAYGPAGEKVLLSIMTRTRTDNPKAQGLQPLIADVTALVLPWLLGGD